MDLQAGELCRARSLDVEAPIVRWVSNEIGEAVGFKYDICDFNILTILIILMLSCLFDDLITDVALCHVNL